ncbi:unnamed protein product [Phytophthora lilii]|uniref:Unnamed protein product n=1 Tax=Phytophthora lilii TaxID=2077276 RepID=A0A9W6TTA7_9STRA|nr:unnamed protein product [Phytophthora lilii]
MKAQAAFVVLISLSGLVSSALATPSWHDLAISAPRYELVHKLNKTSIDFYLRTRAEQGYNAVQTVVISENNGTTRPNFYGDLPFNNSDTTQPNEAYFRLIDWTVDRAASYGLLMVLVPAWGNWISGGWHGTEEPLFNDSTAYEWGKYVGARYPGIPKILGGDTNCLWARNLMKASISYSASPNVDPATLVGTIEDTTHLWVNMRSGVKDGETAQGYEPVILYHPTAGRIARPVSTPEAIGHLMLPKEEDRVSIDAVQSGHATPESVGPFTPFETRDSTKNYELIAAMLDGFTGPVLDLENHYEGAHYNLDTKYPIWNASQVRTGLYNGVYSGAAGFTYGANSVWQMRYASPIRHQATSKPLCSELELLLPARHLLGSPNGYTDVAVNAFESTRFISVLASGDHARYFVYTGRGDSFSLELGNGSDRSGTARWFSPRDGQYYAGSIVSVPASGDSTRVDFTPPSSGGVDNDWVLALEF